MSGTSIDGVDAVLVDFGSAPWRVCSAVEVPFPAGLREQLLGLCDSGPDELHRAAVAGNALAEIYAEAVQEALRKAGLSIERVAAIGCHGQTVRHRPDFHYTVQIGNAALLAELTKIPVVADFRSRDVAAGGEGAPLAPAFHQAAFAHRSVHRAVLNIGGIANVTNLPPNAPAIGFDTGPGNVLMDAWINEHRGERFDAGGAWARTGAVFEDLLTRMLADEYFALAPPKSTGREHFNLQWLRHTLNGDELPADVQATLLQLTARSVASALRRWCRGAAELYVCGGGARNSALMDALAAHLPDVRVAPTEALGIPAPQVEAIAFAWLARETVAGRPGNLPEVTGARGPRILGAIYSR